MNHTKLFIDNDSEMAFMELRNRWKTPAPFAIWAGSGMDQQLSLPNWPQLIENTAQNSGHDLKDASAALKSGDLPEAMQILETKMGRASFRASIARQLGHSEYSNSIVSILGKFAGPIVTTNFTPTIENTLSHCSAHDAPVYLPNDLARAEFALHDHQQCVIKIHGCISSPETLVLTKGDYAQIESPSHPTAEFIRYAWRNTAILFIGTSIVGDAPYRLMAKEAESGNERMRHYALLRDPGRSERLDVSKKLGLASISPMWYRATNELNIVSDMVNHLASRVAPTFGHAVGTCGSPGNAIDPGSLKLVTELYSRTLSATSEVILRSPPSIGSRRIKVISWPISFRRTIVYDNNPLAGILGPAESSLLEGDVGGAIQYAEKLVKEHCTLQNWIRIACYYLLLIESDGHASGDSVAKCGACLDYAEELAVRRSEANRLGDISGTRATLYALSGFPLLALRGYRSALDAEEAQAPRVLPTLFISIGVAAVLNSIGEHDRPAEILKFAKKLAAAIGVDGFDDI